MLSLLLLPLSLAVSEEGVTDITELNLKMNALSSAGEQKEEGEKGVTNGATDGATDEGWEAVGEEEEEEEEEEEWPPRTKKSKKKKGKKKKRNRGRGQESRTKDDGEAGDSANRTGAGEPSNAIVDLCGYSYNAYKAYFVLSVYDSGDVNPLTQEPSNGASKWYIFGKDEKPALWNQQQKGWLVAKKFDDKLDMMGAIKV